MVRRAWQPAAADSGSDPATCALKIQTKFMSQFQHWLVSLDQSHLEHKFCDGGGSFVPPDGQSQSLWLQETPCGPHQARGIQCNWNCLPPRNSLK